MVEALKTTTFAPNGQGGDDASAVTQEKFFSLFAGQTSLAATPDIYHFETSQSSHRNTKTGGRLFGNENGL